MHIVLRSNALKRLVMLLEVVAFLALAIWTSKTYVAELVGRTLTLRNLLLAAKLDPANSDYHLRLGRLFQYSLADVDPERAVEHLKRATEVNPHDPQSWLDLGAALELQGRTAEAEACMRRADSLAPRIPSIQWGIANTFLLHGNVDEAFRHFSVVLAGDSRYNQTLFHTAWKASGDANKILEQLIPNHVPTEFDYLYYLLEQKRYSEAHSVWKRIAGSSETFPPAQASAYIESLIAMHHPAEAHKVWMDLRAKELIKATYEETNRNILVNGDFEEDPLNMGFDWRIAPLEGVDAGLDGTNFHSPGRALLIQFSGKQNVDYRHVYQYVIVAPARSYRLQGFMKTEGITTDSGPRLAVRDAYDQTALDKFSEALTGSTTGWTPIILDFTTGPKTDLIVVDVARLTSHKLDNLIAGKVWVDDLSLKPLPGKAAPSQN